MGKKSLKLSFFFFLFFILSFYSVSGVISGGFCKLTGCTYTGPVVFTNNVTIVTANSLFINNTLSLFDLNNNLKILLNASGDSFFTNNVGIGTTSPDKPLHIDNSGGGEIHLTRPTGATSGFLGVVSFGNVDVDGFLATIEGFQDGATNAGGLIFTTEATAAARTEKMRITSSGLVGIGTTSPSSLLHLEGTNTANLLIKNTLSDGISDITVDANRSNQNNNIMRLRGRWDGNVITSIEYLTGPDTTNKDDGKMAFFTAAPGGSLTEAIRIDEQQRVGIGDTNPDMKLHLNVGSADLGLLKFEADGTRTNLPVLRFRTGTRGYFDLDYFWNAERLEFQYKDSVIMSMTNESRVGIGTSDPDTNLHIEVSGTTPTIDTPSTMLIVQRSAGAQEAGISILGGATSYLDFGDEEDENVGEIRYDHAGNFMNIRVNAQTVIRINSSGNVGIGTTSPREELEVDGDILLTNANSYRFRNAGDSSSASVLQLDASNVLQVGKDTATISFNNGDIFLHSSGNAGIGTTTPTYGLEVTGNISLNGTIFTDSNGRVGIGTTSPANELDVIGASIFHPTAGTDAGQTKIDSESSASRIAQKDSAGVGKNVFHAAGNNYITGGKFGIGTTNPNAQLEVNASTSGIGILTNGSVGIGTTSPSALLTFNNFGENVDILNFVRFGVTRFSIQHNTGGTDYTSFNTLGTNALTLQEGGNVGIGTTTPEANLHVRGDSGFRIESVSNPRYNITIDNVGGQATFDARGPSTFFVFEENGAEVMRIDLNGNVGIGTTSPNEKLVVVGNLNVTKNITSENVFLPQYLYGHTNETIPLNGASQWTNVTISQEDTDIKQGITHDAVTLNHTFTINAPGVYHVDFNYDVIDTSASSTDIDVAGRVIYDNGSEVLGSVFETDITKKDIEVEVSHDFLVELMAGEVIIYQFIAEDADVQISTHGTFGDHPESATVTIIKIANIHLT